MTLQISATGQLKKVAYYEHLCPAKIRAPAKVEFTGGSHVKVYAALGGHATYATAPASGRQPGCLNSITWPGGVKPSDKVGKGPTWQTWPNVHNARTQPWYGFGGNWGTKVTPSTVASYGPIGPGPVRSAASDVVPVGW